MSAYRRALMLGGTFFFTVVTYQRKPCLCDDLVRQALRNAITRVRRKWPFKINAWVLLPDHLHCIWTLPDGDGDFATRWRLIKTLTTRQCHSLFDPCLSQPSRIRRKERNLWQRRYWEHCITNENDYSQHCDYIHYNPVKHRLSDSPNKWPYSTFHAFVKQGIYASDWGNGYEIKLMNNIGHE